VHIIFTGVELLRRTVEGLMDTALSADEVSQTMQLIREQLPIDASFHDLRTRKAGPRRFIEFHLLVPGRTSVNESHALCDRIEFALAGSLSKASVTIHVEPAETEMPIAE
jgi:divalent metal cation (Fe/Co/Zn/Cd) transporter